MDTGDTFLGYDEALTPHLNRQSDTFNIFYQCHLCNQQLKRASLLHKHLREQHDINIGRSLITCLESGCDAEFTEVTYLRRHLANQHGFRLRQDEYYFNSNDEFDQWKDELEQQNGVKYVQCLASDIQRSQFITYYHYCDHGHYGQQLLEGEKKNPCTSLIFQKTNQKTGEISATWFPEHYGHISENEVVQNDYIELSRIEVGRVTTNLRFGRKLKRLMKSSGVFATEDDKLQLLNAKCPRRITVSYGDWEELKNPKPEKKIIRKNLPATKSKVEHIKKPRAQIVSTSISQRIENGNLVKGYLPAAEASSSGTRTFITEPPNISDYDDDEYDEFGRNRKKKKYTDNSDKKDRLEKLLKKTLDSVRQEKSDQVLNEMMPVAITLINMLD